ncbi:hypothetical protein RclHR1_11630004 [Rhizophagus clarus]|uniref:RNase H type-1 domain-containing protein n=1 Tax=Rhizophagus clarus TaxID=94130 RepID=A0A2Z6Q983_9GLOM|nr:hypothetical protein RclHR1_11630004 [Rhizophagus clarus]
MLSPQNKDKTEKIVSIVNEFFDINDIKINGEKSEIIIVNPEESNENDRSLEIGKNKDKVIANKGSVPIRILGVWFKADKEDEHTKVIVKKEISTIVMTIRRKYITHVQAIYIVNTVLLPRLEYRLNTTIWEDGKYEKIFRPVMKEVKHKTRFPSNCHDNILFYSAQGKLKNLWRNQVGAQITEFLVALNSKSKQADILKMRLKKAQLKLNITICILLMKPDVTVPNKIQNNHAYNIMRKAHDYLFKFQPLTESEEWEIQIIGPSTGRYTIQHWITADSEQSINKTTPYKVVQCCSGCALKDKRISKNDYNCYFNKDHTELTCINRVSNHQGNSDYKVIKDIIEIKNHLDKQQILEYTPSYIQMPDYDTALIQNTLASNEAISQHITILHKLRTTFNPFNTINIYTDGSLTDHFNADLNDFTKHMGTSWVIINNRNEVILECCSSITEWPLSTKAELGAILSAILVLQTGQKANIFTDS